MTAAAIAIAIAIAIARICHIIYLIYSCKLSCDKTPLFKAVDS